MPYRTVNAPGTPTPPKDTWSQMKVHSNGHFYVSGMAAEGDSMYEQAKATFECIRKTIEHAGGCMDDIMSMQIFVINLDENKEVWRARREFFSGDYPASTLVQVTRVGDTRSFPPMRVEINCTGYINGSR
ncbi:MAG: RidA family protein [Alphaproteobacteria bacterium]